MIASSSIRVLCLHGAGSNNNLFQHQTATLRAQLQDYSFDFVEGIVAHEGGSWSAYFANRDKADQQELYAYYDLFDGGSMIKAELELIDLLLTANPRFDGILAYSSGCSLAFQAFMRYEAQRNSITSLPLFKFAVFCNAVSPYKVYRLGELQCFGTAPEVESVVKKEIETLVELTMNLRVVANPSAVDEVVKRRKWTKTEMESWEGFNTVDGSGLVKVGDFGLGFFDKDKECLHVPTLHVRDPSEHRLFGTAMQSLCEPRLARECFHSHGHEFPRGYHINKDMAELVRTIASLAA